MKSLETPVQYAGNKTRKMKELLRLFPKDNSYDGFVDLFCGTGSVSYHLIKREIKQYGTIKRRYTLNDINNDIYYMHRVLKDEKLKNELIDVLHNMPQHEGIFQRQRLRRETARRFHAEILEILSDKPLHQNYLNRLFVNEIPQEELVERVAYFLTIQNYTLYSLGQTFRGVAGENPKRVLLNRLKNFNSLFLENVILRNRSFDDVVSRIAFRSEAQKKKWFVYADPPYLDTHNPYGTAFPQSQTKLLFEKMAEYAEQGMKVAISEFDKPLLQELAGDYGFTAHKVCERINIKNRETEMLYIKGYEPTVRKQKTFFEFVKK